jgi:hypothetical protein
MLLVASLDSANTDSLAKRVAGADAGILRIAKLSSGVKTLVKVATAVPDIPWGGWLEGIAEGEVELLAKADFDFVVFPHRTPLAILVSETAGRILEIGESLSASLLPVVDELPVDAVFVSAGREGSLTWQHLMFLQRCAGLSAKPLLTSIPSKISASELQALWGAGVSGVVAEVATGQPVNASAELRRVIDALTLPPRKRKRVDALLPYTYTGEGTDAEEEEE